MPKMLKNVEASRAVQIKSVYYFDCIAHVSSRYSTEIIFQLYGIGFYF